MMMFAVIASVASAFLAGGNLAYAAEKRGVLNWIAFFGCGGSSILWAHTILQAAP